MLHLGNDELRSEALYSFTVVILTVWNLIDLSGNETHDPYEPMTSFFSIYAYVSHDTRHITKRRLEHIL